MVSYGVFNLAPQRHTATTDRNLVADVVEQVRVAEALGYDIAWIAEHHFSNLSLSPSPLMTLAHLAGVTERIGLGTGVAVLPLYQPMRLVEEIAYVDILSGGRLHLGIGSGSQNHESRGLGTDLAEARACFEEVLDILEMAFDQGRVAHEGRHFQIPETVLSLRPVQTPHPPVYFAGLSGDAPLMERVARRGYIPFASASWMPVAAVAAKRDGYVEGRRAAGLDPTAMPFAVQRLIYVADDAADAADAAEHAVYTYRVVAAAKSGAARFDGHVIQAEPVPGEDDVATILAQGMVGSVEHVAEKLVADIQGLGLTHMSCFMSFGGLSHARVVRSMERFMGEVVPLAEAAISGGGHRAAGD